VLNILDEGVREALVDVVVDKSITAQRVVRTLEQIKAERGLPSVMRVDNGALRCLPIGVRPTISGLPIFNQGNRIRMPTSNGSIVRSEMRFWIHTFLAI
jgi:hypothetical protein